MDIKYSLVFRNSNNSILSSTTHRPPFFPALPRGNNIMVSISVCHPGLSLAQSICFRKVNFCQNVINLSSPVPPTGLYQRPCHVLSCLCDNAFIRSLAICHQNRASYLISRLMPVPIWLACAEQGCKYDTNKQSL